jgi:hypothetical protein
LDFLFFQVSSVGVAEPRPWQSVLKWAGLDGVPGVPEAKNGWCLGLWTNFALHLLLQSWCSIKRPLGTYEFHDSTGRTEQFQLLLRQHQQCLCLQLQLCQRCQYRSELVE